MQAQYREMFAAPSSTHSGRFRTGPPPSPLPPPLSSLTTSPSTLRFDAALQPFRVPSLPSLRGDGGATMGYDSQRESTTTPDLGEAVAPSTSVEL